MREKLIKLLQLTQSPNDFEALAAIRKANEILRRGNIDWEKFLTPPEPQFKIITHYPGGVSWHVRYSP